MSGYKAPSFAIQIFVSRRLRSLRCFSHFDRVQGWFDKDYDSDAFTVSPVEVVRVYPRSLPLTLATFIITESSRYERRGTRPVQVALNKCIAQRKEIKNCGVVRWLKLKLKVSLLSRRLWGVCIFSIREWKQSTCGTSEVRNHLLKMGDRVGRRGGWRSGTASWE